MLDVERRGRQNQRLVFQLRQGPLNCFLWVRVTLTESMLLLPFTSIWKSDEAPVCCSAAAPKVSADELHREVSLPI
jgi:hypothetical protein